MSEIKRTNNDRLRCDHCQQTVSRTSAIIATINGDEKVFCCHGCLGVYELLHNNALDTFYNERCTLQPTSVTEGKAPEAAAFRDTVISNGNEQQIDVLLSGIRCASCVWLVETVLLKQQGILSARVNYATHKATITWQQGAITLDTILQTLHKLGYQPHPYRGSSNDVMIAEKQDLLLRFGTASFFSMQLMLFTAALYAGFFDGMESRYKLAFQLIALALATPVIFYSGYPFLANALRAIKRLTLNMDVLIALGSLASYLYSIAMIFADGEVFFDTSAMIITSILLGRFLEAGSRLKANNAIAELAELQPHEALRVSNNGETNRVAVATIQSGEVIEILAGNRIPLDGKVVEGEAEVNEAMLSGESTPVLKGMDSEVFAGSTAMNGRLRVRVSGNASTTLLAQIIRTVEEAQARKAPIQSLADKTAAYFVPAIIALATVTFLYWKFTNGNTVIALMNAVSVLVIACPCALGLATPLALLVATTATSRHGLLVKGGDVMENLSTITTVVLDKTGTITTGKPSLTDCFLMDENLPFIQHAASLEALSEHPTARAITAAWQGERLEVTHFKAITGKGVSGIIEQTHWYAGSKAFMEQEKISIAPKEQERIAALEAEGKTVVIVARDRSIVGIIGMIDELRSDALPLINGLRTKGLKLHLFTGDNKGVARYIAERCGISDVQAEQSPLDKAARIRALQAHGERVMMVGDGINDAPALTEATVGVTLGNASAIALDSAGVAILHDDLRLITTLLNDASRCFSIIRQNLVWAFSYNLIALPLAVSGTLHPIVSALLMATSSLVVVSNSLRLRKSSRKTAPL
uniref:Heavy metal translocating P-type ATPase n=1 Tax=Chlorobium chlorochromatii (strain CaD3) TaxID=340177 RepID=Q3AQU8_CHLCH